jgi:hypothetical protein
MRFVTTRAARAKHDAVLRGVVSSTACAAARAHGKRFHPRKKLQTFPGAICRCTSSTRPIDAADPRRAATATDA